MKLLFDQNLSPSLVAKLKDLFPGSAHLRDLKLAEAPDSVIWGYARDEGFVIVTKDKWFHQRALLSGPPPKVVWIRTGNCATRQVEMVLRQSALRLQRFVDEPTRAYLGLS